MELVPGFVGILQGLSATMTAPTFASLTTVLTGWVVIDYRSKASVHYGFPERNRCWPLLTNTFRRFPGVPNY
jgi:hypothetical protein